MKHQLKEANAKKLKHKIGVCMFVIFCISAEIFLGAILL